MTWDVRFTPAARRDLGKLPARVQGRISTALRKLAEDPHAAPNVKRLSDGSNQLRVGDYRIIYDLHDRVLIVQVLTVGHRREVYR